MFEITTYPLTDIQRRLQGVLNPGDLRLVDPILEREFQPAVLKSPFVQLGHEDLDPTFFDTVFAYADIGRTNGPVGLDGNFNPIHHKPDVVVFPLTGFERHLEQSASDLVAALRAEGEPNRFLSAAHQYRSAQELLIAGLLACILFARQHHQGMVIRW